MTPRHTAAVLLGLAALAACTSPDDDPLPVPADSASADAPAPAETATTRAAEAGLSQRQADALAALGVPVYVPVLPEGWRLESAAADSTVEAGMVWPDVTLRYRTDRETCLAVIEASEGLGDVMVQDPPHERDVRIAGIPMHSPARLGWGIAGERAEGWEDGRVASEWAGTDLLAVRIETDTDTDCLPASPEAAETLLASLRPLDPADDAATIGPVSFTDVPAFDVPALGDDPEAAALAAVGGGAPGERRQGTTVETLLRRPRLAVVLVTTADAADDSVRDQRTRVVLVRGAAGWRVHSAGEQVRCQPGRGHADWSAEFCV